VNASEVFEGERSRLLGLAYRTLGTFADAEDVVQESWLRLQRTELTSLDNPAAWLTTVTTRLAIDRLRQQQRSREEYVGPWLPEPIATTVDPSRTVEMAESLTAGFLVVLETLGPNERAAFLLVEVFGEPYAQVAAILDRSEASCRQLVHRARVRIEEGRPRFKASPAEAEQVAAAFAQATMSGDMDALLALISDEIQLISDGGALQHAARRPIVRPDQVARFLLNVLRRLPAGVTFENSVLNGEPSLILWNEGAPMMTMQLDIGANQVQRIRFVINRNKLSHLTEPVPLR
jgi:RNA polymerase sigma-70 factor, ECF subfamily